jgi:predicted metal-dependent phosphoesterase TrpH
VSIDLHAHSTASDGTDAPEEMVTAAAAAGLTVVALTDHDTYAGWEPAAAAAVEAGVALVRGVEISCQHRGISIHLLAYLVDPTHAGLTSELARARASRDTRVVRIVERMAADGIPITVEQVRAVAGAGATLGRPHIADALVRSGRMASRDEAFTELLHNESEYYIPHYAPDPVRAVELVREAGGVAVMAHPFANRRGRTVEDSVIATMTEAGMPGLEVWHPDHDASEVAHAQALAERLGLLALGSSDYHGTGKVNRLGQHTTAVSVLARIEELATSGIGVVRG